MDKGLFVRKGDSFEPADARGESILKKVKVGESCLMEVYTARNAKQMRLLFACLELTVENSESFKSKEQLLDAIKYELGHYETVRTLGGASYVKLKSIAFDAMKQDDFKKFFDEALRLMSEHLGIDVLTLTREANQ